MPLTRSHRGFTVTELLVTMSVILLLAVMLVPVFARAREVARSSQSDTKRKQITALTVYAADYDNPDYDHTRQLVKGETPCETETLQTAGPVSIQAKRCDFEILKYWGGVYIQCGGKCKPRKKDDCLLLFRDLGTEDPWSDLNQRGAHWSETLEYRCTCRPPGPPPPPKG